MTDGMSGKAAGLLLEFVVKSIDGIPDVQKRVFLTPKKHIGNGEIEDTFYYVNYFVGIREFVENPDKSFSRAEVAGALIALFHEICGHGGQIYGEFEKEDDSLSKVLALNYYACKGSRLYHGVIDTPDGEKVLPHYFRHPHEIAAQYVGIDATNTFLAAIWGKEAAAKAICEAHADRLSGGSGYIGNGRPRDSIEEILADLNREFRRRAFEKRTYFPGKDPSDAIAYSDDSTKRGKALAWYPDGVKQDLMMASLLLRNDHNHRISGKAVFKSMRIDVDTAFNLWRLPPVSMLDRGRNMDL